MSMLFLNSFVTAADKAIIIFGEAVHWPLSSYFFLSEWRSASVCIAYNKEFERIQ